MTKDEIKINALRSETFRAGIMLALAFSFLLGLYAPLELYFTNITEFQFDLYALLPVILPLFGLLLAAGAVAAIVCACLKERVASILLTAAFLVYLCTYIQGMFLVGNLPPLDGRAVVLGAYKGEIIKSVLLWIIAAAVMLLLKSKLGSRKMLKVISGGAVFFSAVLLVTLITVGLTNGGFAHKHQVAATKAGELTMSKNQNLVIFVIDAVDATAFTELLEGSDPEFSDILEDFTYYPDTVSAYPFTKHSIPFILTGAWYENEVPFPEYAVSSYEGSPLLTELRQENYRMGLYEEEIVWNSDGVFQFENTVESSLIFTNPLQAMKAEVKLVWFKYAPFFLKQYGRVDISDFNKLLHLKGGDDLYRPYNDEVFKDLQEGTIETVEEKCFRFIHIEGAHVPFRYDRDVNIIDESEGSYLQNIQCSMTILRAYLDRLRAAGVYDNTAIVVMGDHGYGYNRDVHVLGRCNPLLAVKGIGEQHPFAVSGAPISYEDLQTAYHRLLAGKTGEGVFDAREGDRRERRCLLYFYQQEERMLEYIQTGHASNLDTLLPTGREYRYAQ